MNKKNHIDLSFVSCHEVCVIYLYNYLRYKEAYPKHYREQLDKKSPFKFQTYRLITFSWSFIYFTCLMIKIETEDYLI